MLANILGVIVLLALAVLCGWLILRLARSPSWLKWLGILPLALLGLIFLAAAGVGGRGVYLLYRPLHYRAAQIQVAGTPEQITRGAHLVSFACAGCHSKDGSLPLSGGNNLSGDTGLPLGDIYGANLTPGGEIKSWTDGEILRAVRYGMAPSGRQLLMPIDGIRGMSDEDLEAVIAYLRSQPTVESRPPATRPNLLLATLVGANLFKFNPTPLPEIVTAPPTGVTAEYGNYLIGFTDCRSCHGQNLEGGAPPNPVGPNLRLAAAWTQEQFISTMRTGVTPYGQQLSSVMPVRTLKNLDDTELAAIYQYIVGLKGK
jgi:mono/diheme cytochrome c family protein